MRQVLLTLLAGLGPAASIQAFAGQVPPSMIYDCERPELAALSKELGRTVCVQYDMIAKMNTVGPTVEAAARAFVGQSIKIKTSADPDAITCREHDVAFRPPTVICAHNSDWNQRWRRSFREGRLEPFL
jgi:hypothetical protein